MNSTCCLILVTDLWSTWITVPQLVTCLSGSIRSLYSFCYVFCQRVSWLTGLIKRQRDVAQPSTNSLRLCSVNPHTKWIEVEWRGLEWNLTCMGLNPPQSLSIPSKNMETEQALSGNIITSRYMNLASAIEHISNTNRTLPTV